MKKINYLVFGIALLILSSFAYGYGTGSDGNLTFTTAIKSYGSMTVDIDYTISGDTLYLMTNRIYNFENIIIGSGTILSTQNTTGTTLYLLATGIVNISGSIRLDNIRTPSIILNQNFTVGSEIYYLKNNGAGGRTYDFYGGTSSSQNGGFGGGGEGTVASCGGCNATFYTYLYYGVGSNGYSTMGSGGNGNLTINCGQNLSTKGSNGTLGSAGGAGGMEGFLACGFGTHINITAGAGGDSWDVNGNGESGTNASGFVYNDGAWDAYTYSWSGGGGGGAGGRAGKSGYNLVIKSDYLTLNGNINVSGNRGGNGGNGSASLGITGYGGAGGGAGGGGSSGNVFLTYSYYNNNSLNIFKDSGSGGSGGYRWYYTGFVQQAESGSSGVSGSINITEAPLVQLINLYNNSIISTFFASISNSTSRQNFSTTNGTIIYPYGMIVNITFYNISANTYLNITYTNLNLTSYFAGNTSRSAFNITTIYGYSTSTPVYGAFINITNTKTGYSYSFQNDLSTSTRLVYLDNSTYNYTASLAGFPSTSGVFNVSLLRTSPMNITFPLTANFWLKDEKTDAAFNIAGTTEINLLIICRSQTTQSINITNTTPIVPISCDYSKIKFTVYYGNVSYYRTLLSSYTDIVNQTVYLIDLTTTQAIYNSFIIDDLLNEYDNPRLYISKFIGSSSYTIVSDYIDMQNKLGAYLIESNSYTFTLKSDNRPDYILGDYGADASGSIQIRLYNFDTVVSSEYASTAPIITFAYNASGGYYAYGFYNDSYNTTTSITWNLYHTQYNNTLDLISTTTTASNPVTFTPVNISLYYDNDVFSEFIYTKNGVQYIYMKQINAGEAIRPAIFTNTYLHNNITQKFINWFIIIFISIISLSATKTTGDYVAWGIIAFAAFFTMFGWFTISTIILVFAALLVFISKVTSTERRSV
jgi:hypothetical protein